MILKHSSFHGIYKVGESLEETEIYYKNLKNQLKQEMKKKKKKVKFEIEDIKNGMYESSEEDEYSDFAD